MDKETLSNYGWIVICVLVLAVMVAFAGPFGNYIANAIDLTSQGLVNVNNEALEAVGIQTKNQCCAVFAKYFTNPDCHNLPWEHTEDCYTFEETTLTWDELMLAENGEKYDYDVDDLSTTTITEAFRGCDSLTTIDLSGCTNLSAICDFAFDNCVNLTSVKLPSNLVTIGESAFSCCDSLTTVDLSGCTNLKTISFDAFSCCDSLTTVDLSGCTNLISLGTNLNPDCQGPFYSCESLTTVDLSGCTNLKIIGNEAFAECTSLTSIKLPTSVTAIRYCAFEDCESLVTVDLSGCTNLTTIDEGAFEDCTSLTSITIPESVTTIGDDAFYDCESLTDITFHGTTTQWKAISKGSNWKKNIPATYVQCSDGQVALS